MGSITFVFFLSLFLFFTSPRFSLQESLYFSPLSKILVLHLSLQHSLWYSSSRLLFLPITKMTRDLPEEMIMEIFARFPISNHHVLSKTSKKLEHYMRSREVYKERSKIFHGESVIHVGLSASLHQTHWYPLPSRTSSCKKFPHIAGMHNTVLAADSKIYAIGGKAVNRERSSEIMCIDCVSYRQVKVPNMKCIHASPETAVIQDKLYVIGGVRQEDSLKFFDESAFQLP